jgi:CDP-diacylglycerol--glycerol-3-phosphate 3-phosphatidyltransferase
VLGKLKTGVQIATILAVIAVAGHPAWLTALIYAMVAVTLISGLDYFFGLRRHLQAAREAVESSSQPAQGIHPPAS